MRIIKPNTIDDGNFVSSNVPEDDAPEWDESTAYVVGPPASRVMLDHIVYQAAANNTGKDPRDEENRTIWPIVGMTNRWRMFDMTRGTEIQTMNDDSIIVEFDMQMIYSSLALFGLDARSVRIEIIDGSNGVVYDETQQLVSLAGINYFFAWFYTPTSSSKQFVTTELPYYPSARIRVSVLKPGGVAKVGKLVIGRAQELGCTAYGTNVRFLDFSRKERDDFGNFVIVERRRVSERTFQVKVDSSRLASVESIIKDLGTTPTVFVGSPNHEVTFIFGLAIDFNSDYTYKKTNYSLKVQEF